MCFGRSKSYEPEVISEGPSQEEIDAQNQQMEVTRQQMEEANQRLQSQLDQQIATANADRARLSASLAEQAAAKEAEAIAAKAAEAIAAQAGPYTTSTTAAAPLPGTAMTTEPIKPIKPKKKQSAGLTIAPAGVAAAAGAGLNIGT